MDDGLRRFPVIQRIWQQRKKGRVSWSFWRRRALATGVGTVERAASCLDQGGRRSRATGVNVERKKGGGKDRAKKPVGASRRETHDHLPRTLGKGRSRNPSLQPKGKKPSSN